jgi:hypothetical protein
MKKALACAMALLLAAGCSDEAQKAAAPTAPPAVLKSTAGAPGAFRASTVCASYARDRALAKASLSDLPTTGLSEKQSATGARLQRRIESLDALIKGACQ